MLIRKLLLSNIFYRCSIRCSGVLLLTFNKIFAENPLPQGFGDLVLEIRTPQMGELEDQQYCLFIIFIDS